MVENQKRQKVKVLRPDNGGKYTSAEFKAYLASKGIEHQLSILRRPKENEVAELMNQAFIELACNIRLQANMSEGIWADAISHA